MPRLELIAAGTVLTAFTLGSVAGGGPFPSYGSVGDALRFSPFRICQKPEGGFGPVAIELMKGCDKIRQGGGILVSSDSSGEGMFIAEAAMHEEHRPDHYARRASKELAASTWNGGGYKAKFDSDGALLTWLTSGAVDYLVVDTAVPVRNRKPHHEMLRRVIAAHPEQFERVASHSLIRGGEDLPGEVQAFRIHRQ